MNYIYKIGAKMYLLDDAEYRNILGENIFGKTYITYKKQLNVQSFERFFSAT